MPSIRFRNYSAKKPVFAGIIFLFSLPFSSCGPSDDEIVQAKVAERVQVFKAKQYAVCEQSLRADAEKIVDSLLLFEATQALNDSLSSARPGRPVKPPVVPPIDSLSIQPIFHK